MQRTISWAALVVAAVGLGGCAAATDSPVVGDPTVEQRARWALPLDAYIGGAADAVTTDYAENLLISECMAERGIDWPVPAIDVAELHSDTRSPSGRAILTVPIAQTYGYHSDPILPDDVVKKLTELNSEPASPGDDAAFEECLDVAREEIPLPEMSQWAAQLANQALDESAGAPEVLAAAARWKSCMSVQGVSDLPDAPYSALGDTGGMPSASLITEFALGDLDSEPTAAEITLATADATCRAESGYDDALYDAEWAAQTALLTEHADDLERERGVQETRLAQARDVIAERTGS